jgi:hypothetical protein
MDLSRRDFLGKVTYGAAAVAMLSLSDGCRNNKHVSVSKSTIVRVTNKEATKGRNGRDNVDLNESVIREMVAQGVKALTGRKNLEEAWAEIISDPKGRVAIKVNCQTTSIYTKAKIVKAVTEGLILRGVAPSNIVVYDLTDNAFRYAGFSKNAGPGIKIGTNDELGGYSWKTWFGIPAPFIGGNRFCKVLAGEGEFGCDYLINIPVVKALDGYSGVSMSMKNHFGSIYNCGKLHPTIQDSVAALNAHRLIVEKTRLIVADGIFAQYKWVNGRNQDTVDTTNQLLFGYDPVAVDYIGWQLLESLRERHNLSPIDPKPEFIHRAAINFGLGNADAKSIDVREVS